MVCGFRCCYRKNRVKPIVSESENEPPDPDQDRKKPNQSEPEVGAGTAKNYSKDKGWKEDQAQKIYIQHRTALNIIAHLGFFWDFGIIMLQISHVYNIIYDFLFEIPSMDAWITFEIMESIYIFDILLRQGIELWRYYTGNMILILPLQYTCGLILMDFISILPLERVLFLVGNTSDIKTYKYWLGCCKLNRVFRLGRLRTLVAQLEEEIKFDERILFVVKFMSDLFFIVQALAFGMYAINLQFPLDWIVCEGGQAINSSGTWLIHRETKPLFRNKLIPEGKDLYYFSVNYVITCLTCVGFGDVYPNTILEQIFTLVIILIGAIYVRGVLASHLTTFHLEIDEPRFDLFYRLNAMIDFLKSHNSHRFFDSRVKDYYQGLWNSREGISEISFDDEILPLSLVEEISFDLCRDMFAKCQILSDLDEPFLKAVARAVQFVLFPTGAIIFTPGKHPGAMYYLISGELVVRSRYNEATVACVLSPGCIIGETLLLYDMQSLCRIESKDECSLLRLRNEELQLVFNEYPHICEAIYERVSEKFDELPLLWSLKGKDLVKWVEKTPAHRQGRVNASFPQDIKFRRMSVNGFIVTDEAELLNDTETLGCYQGSWGKNESPALWKMMSDVTIPYILTSTSGRVATANGLVCIYVFLYAIIGPYCYAYFPTSEKHTADYFVCPIVVDQYYIFLFINYLDFWYEFYMLTNYTSWRDRVNYSLLAGVNTMTFWFDILCFLPFDLIWTDRSPILIRAVSKLHKIFRILKARENKYPSKNVVFMRLLKATGILLFTSHFVACILFTLACPHGFSQSWDACPNNTWMDSYKLDEVMPPQVEGNLLRLFFPYLIALHFAMAMITGLGYGDFNPKTEIELFHSSLFMLLGLFLAVLCTASLTSGFASGVRPKLVFEQRLVTIRQFMDHHHLDKKLQSRVVEHYELQHQLINGVSLPQGFSNMFYDSPDFISKDKDWLETDIFLQGVPIFSKANASILSRVGKLLTRYLLPPEIIFLHRGEVRRQMYIIANGSVAMLHNKTKQPVAVYETTAHFGIRDLLWGEPAPLTVKTLSYVLLFVLDQSAYEDTCQEDIELWELIKAEGEDLRDKNEKLKKARGGIDVHEDEGSQERSAEDVLAIDNWIVFNKEGESGLKYTKLENYEEAYNGTTYPRFYRRCLMRRTVHPSGNFAKAWAGFISVISMMSFICLVWESCFGYRRPWFRVVQYSLDALHLADLYIKLHWAYFATNNLLISHPIKTAIKYVWDGTFLYDMLMLVPIELTTWIFGSTNFLGYGPGYHWYTKLRWNRGFQIIKFMELLGICRGVFRNRTTSLIALYLFTTTSIAFTMSGVAMYLSCPSFPHRWEEGDEYKLPACERNSWSQINEDVLLHTFSARLCSSCYYVTEVILGIGYGDLVNITVNELIFLVILSIVGFLIVQLTLADLTAAQVDSDEIRGVFLESRNAVVRLLTLANASPKFVEGVNRHFKHTWKKSKGLQPRTLFEDLHPALEADLFRDFVGDQLSKVPIFKNFSETEVRTLCQYMRKEFFLKGERMSRAGNLEFQMFIIVDGEVFVASRRLDWECTLRKNEFFGEISMLYGMPRSHNAFAATDVEVFVLDADDFATMLERYPTVREKMIETLGNTEEEYFVKKVERKRKLGNETFFEMAEQNNQEIKSFVKSHEVFQYPIVGLDDEIFEVKTKKNIFVRIVTNIAGRGTLDKELPFFYLATNESKECSFLIHPNCQFMVWLELLYKLVFFLSPMLAIYKVVFLTNFNMDTKGVLNVAVRTEIKLTEYILLLTDILEGIMILRILVSLITPFLRDDGSYCKKFWRIAQRYLTSTQFLFDWLTVTPYSWIIDIMSPNKFKAVSHKFCLVRILRIIPFLKAVAARSDDLDVSAFRYKLILSSTYFVMLTQFSAGIFFTISCPYPGFDTCIDGGWVERAQQQARRTFGNNLTNIAEWNLPSRHYFRSLYWVIVTVTTCGFGDIVPRTLDEMCFALALFLVGTFSLAVMLGNITTGLAATKKGERDFVVSIRNSVGFLRSAGLSENIQNLVMAYFDRMWFLSRGVPYSAALSVLPLTMQIDASTAIYSNILRKCKFFGKVTDFTFIRAISIHVTHSHYLPGDRIVSEGEFGSKLYIVFKGEVAAYVTDEVTSELIYKKSYRPEEAFGKVPALFQLAPYNKTYRSEGYCEVLVMHQHDIVNISSYYKQWRDHLQVLVEHRYASLIGQYKSIFDVAQSQVKEQIILTFADLMAAELKGPNTEDENNEQTGEEVNSKKSAKSKAKSGTSRSIAARANAFAKSKRKPTRIQSIKSESGQSEKSV